jgi:hypothetical protein
MRLLFAKPNEDLSQSQSGGRGSVKPQPSAAAAAHPVAASDGPLSASDSSSSSSSFLPLDHPDFRAGQPLVFQFHDGAEITGFLDPQYGIMDQRGVKFPEGVVPTGWRLQ